MNRFIVAALALASAACNREPTPPNASVTMKLPPPHAYAPKPGFSITGSPGDDAPAAPTEVDG